MKIKNIFGKFYVLILSTALLLACSPINIQNNNNPTPNLLDVKFQVTLPDPLDPDEKIYLEILDEITGVNLNPTRVELAAIDDLNYSINIPTILGSFINYRYVKIGDTSTVEVNGHGEKVDYRLIIARENEPVNDKIVSWHENNDFSSTSEISGYIYDATSDSPLGEMMVFINGMKTTTSFDGYYQFTNMPPGEFSLVAIHPSGKYEPFQQKAIIAENSITPASFGMKPSKMVDVTFNVQVPENTPIDASIRLMGNLYSMGNTFTTQPNGSGIIASRSPVLLRKKGDTSYYLSLNLPAGYDIRYKYSFGDHLINAEHQDNGEFFSRQLIVPQKNSTINDEILSWQTPASEEIVFKIRTPQNTPENTAISIQFNPYVWMNPIPMWKSDNNTWSYALLSPLEYMRNAQFRFCRDERCGIADDELTNGISAQGFLLAAENDFPGNIDYTIEKWAWQEAYTYPIPQVEFNSQNNILIKGFSFTEDYQMNWLPYIQSGMIDAGVAGANWIIISPGWIFNNSPKQGISFDWNRFPSSVDISYINKLSSEAGMSLVFYPKPGAATIFTDIWYDAELSFGWWNNWFKSYERMILNYADLAEKTGVNTLIIGGNSVSPAFPNGFLPNGSSSNAPYDSEAKWLSLIEKIRSRFGGQIGFALPYSSINENNLDNIITKSDFIFLEMNGLALLNEMSDINSIETRFDELLNNEISKLYATIKKPLIISIDYYAIEGSISNCSQIGEDCRTVYEDFLKGGEIKSDIFEQADIYQAILRSLIKQNWITGIVSSGYNPVISLQDASNSVRGKPAYEILSYFFNNL